jgi:ribosomal protein L37AE/L43A
MSAFEDLMGIVSNAEGILFKAQNKRYQTNPDLCCSNCLYISKRYGLGGIRDMTLHLTQCDETLENVFIKEVYSLNIADAFAKYFGSIDNVDDHLLDITQEKTELSDNKRNEVTHKCPHCGSVNVIKHSLGREKCKNCSKTFAGKHKKRNPPTAIGSSNIPPSALSFLTKYGVTSPLIVEIDKNNIRNSFLLENKGIYIIFTINEMVVPLYVGKAINIRNRWLKHHRYNDIHLLAKVNRLYVAFIIENEFLTFADLDKSEAILIQRLNPVLNKRKEPL